MRSADSNITGFKTKAEPGDPDYPDRVAKPVMSAVDGMPAEFRACVHEYGYVDVFRAWRRGWTVDQIRAAARDGRFVLP